MDAIVKFKEAAKELQNDDRYLAYAAARKAYNEDDELQAQIGEFNLVKLDLNNEMAKDDRDEQKITTLNNRIGQLYAAIMASDKMNAMNQAKEGVEGVIQYVNVIINAAIEGRDPMDVEEPASDCGGGCASCAGCG